LHYFLGLILENTVLNVYQHLRLRAILPVSAASPLGAICSGKKVHAQDQEAILPVSDSAREVRLGIKKVRLGIKNGVLA
jgi:hypothetical protein